LIIEACAEAELSYEYRHGVTSYGAFTYTLTKTLRNAGRQKHDMTFRQLVEEARARLRDLGYRQTPAILGPDNRVNAVVPYKPSSGEGEDAPPA
jgi:metacaspase-1